MKHISEIPKCNTCVNKTCKNNNSWCTLFDKVIPDMFFYFCHNHKEKIFKEKEYKIKF